MATKQAVGARNLYKAYQNLLKTWGREEQKLNPDRDPYCYIESQINRSFRPEGGEEIDSAKVDLKICEQELGALKAIVDNKSLKDFRIPYREYGMMGMSAEEMYIVNCTARRQVLESFENFAAYVKMELAMLMGQKDRIPCKAMKHLYPDAPKDDGKLNDKVEK